MAAVAFNMAGSPSSPKKATTVKKPVTASLNKGKASDVDPSELKATFEPVNLSTRDVFKPLVVREGQSGGMAALPNQVPPAFTGGDAGWYYTGTAVVDQVPTALVENTGTGEGLYLKQGDQWKNCKVERITPTTLTLSQGDTVRTLLLLADSPSPSSEGGSAPLNPLSGQIGVQRRPSPAPGANAPGANASPQTASNGAQSDSRRQRRFGGGDNGPGGGNFTFGGNGQDAQPSTAFGGPGGPPPPDDFFQDDLDLSNEVTL